MKLDELQQRIEDQCGPGGMFATADVVRWLGATGKNAQDVRTSLNRLEKKGGIERQTRGIYKLANNNGKSETVGDNHNTPGLESCLALIFDGYEDVRAALQAEAKNDVRTELQQLIYCVKHSLWQRKASREFSERNKTGGK
jgi:hypothetical protein